MIPVRELLRLLDRPDADFDRLCDIACGLADGAYEAAPDDTAAWWAYECLEGLARAAAAGEPAEAMRAHREAARTAIEQWASRSDTRARLDDARRRNFSAAAKAGNRARQEKADAEAVRWHERDYLPMLERKRGQTINALEELAAQEGKKLWTMRTRLARAERVLLLRGR